LALAVAFASVAGQVMMAKEFWNLEDQRILLQASASLVGSTGSIGYRHWRGNSGLEELEPTSALTLNWINIVCAALMFRRLAGNRAGIPSAPASCLVIWWLTMGPTKLQFKGRTVVS